MYTGGCCDSMTRIWDGDVSVLSTVSASRYMDASGERAGCQAGMLSAVKL